MTTKEARARFAEIVARNEQELELDRAALLIAAEEYPHLDVELYIAHLDAFADSARANDDPAAAPRSRVLALAEVLSAGMGFNGNADKYYDARNSFLNDVIDRRTGIPITLSVVYIETARRIGLPLFGVGMPGHFLVKFADEEQEMFLDPFNGGQLLSADQCRQMIERRYGGERPFRPEYLFAVTKKQILARMLQNLKGIYAGEQDYARTLGLIERVLLLNPDTVTEIRDRGLVCLELDRYAPALADLELYLRRAPDAADGPMIRERIKQLKQKQARLN